MSYHCFEGLIKGEEGSVSFGKSGIWIGMEEASVTRGGWRRNKEECTYKEVIF